MRWLAYFRFVRVSCLCLLAGLLAARSTRAQTGPAGQGLVADSTELRVLRQFYQATGGDFWADHTGWPASATAWGTATLADAASWRGVQVQQGDISGLLLPANSLRGPLPAGLSQLAQLQRLNLRQNALTDSIPARLGQLSQLGELALGSNQLSGPIPAALGNLAQLTYLELGSNQLTGPIPASLGQLSQLQNLSLCVNQLTGPLPASLGELHQLQRLELWQNNWQDSIPAAWGGLQQLRILNLNQCGLRGRLPKELGQLHVLQALGLYLNQLTGPVPAELGNCRQLSYLNLEWNHLTGPLPASLGRLTQLEYLRVGQNQLSGPLPDSLGACRHLTTLILDHNHFSGSLPVRWGRLRALTYLDANTNQLTGALPDSLGTCSNLQWLYLSHNQLQGPLPAAWRRLTQLHHLFLNDNQLTGPLPAGWGWLTDLRILLLGSNQLTGTLPDSLGRLSNLTQLGLDRNQLTGSLRVLTHLSSLNLLNAERNRFSGPLPGGLGRLPSLMACYLGHNQLSGPLPDSLGLAPQLRQLLLDHNQLGDTIPASVLRLATLYQLELSANAFTDLEDLGGATGLPAVVGLSFNQLPYVSLERLYVGPGQSRFLGGGGNPQGLDTSWQSPGPGVDTVRYQRGQALTLPAPRGLVTPHTYGYQWQRLVGGQWADMPGDTLSTKIWAQATAAEQGSYRLRVRDHWFTDQGIYPSALYSKPVFADLLPYRPLARNLPDDANQGSGSWLAPALGLAEDTARTGDINFVRSFVPRVALTDAGRIGQAPIDSVACSTQYLDGLGRPLQEVQHQAAPGKLDIVQPHHYDGLGREPYQFLSYAAAPTSQRQGYHAGALSAQDAFYRRTAPVGGSTGPLSPQDPIQGVARTGVAYSQTLFEASPLNRVVAQSAPGEAWRLTGGHPRQQAERPNVAADSVLYFLPGYTASGRDPGYQGLYAAGELWGTEHDDEHGFVSVEWKDKRGQVVQRQVQTGRVDTVGAPAGRWLRTCYVYDDLEHLRYVLQPEASKRVLALGTVPAALPVACQPFLFHYRYDGRGRQVAKQVPGQDGETVVVYDQLDRPVLSQDAAQRQRREWSWTKYDALGRVVLAGLVARADTAGQVTLQALAAADTASSQQYEQRLAASTASPHGLTTTQSFPRLGQQGFTAGQVLTVSYYDDYDFDNDGQPDAAYDTRHDGQFASGRAPVADALRTTGLVTRTKTRVLGVAENDAQQAAWLVSTTFYDERARPVQVQATNARKGLDLVTTQLDFTGKVVQSVTTHEGPHHAALLVTESFTYDHAGRVLSARQQLPGEAQPVAVSQRRYNALGQLVTDSLGSGWLRQAVDYAYNSRGWLTSLNDPYQPSPGDLFALSLHYERGFTAGYEQYNGNLTGQTWRGRDGVQRAYGYVYDPVSRLLQGDFVARAQVAGSPGTGAWNRERDNYRLSFVSYDDNGNLLTLRRRGLLQAASSRRAKQYGPVDALHYAYQGNRLLAVQDAVSGNQLPQPASYHGAPTSLAGDFQEAGVQQAQEYLYDANGNLTQDKNKNLTGLLYNHLNLPRQLHFGQGADSLVFRYSAAGQKVAKLVYQAGKPVQRTDYLGAYQYEGDSLRFFPHAAGRVLRFVSQDPVGQVHVRYQREFTIKDHLGNLRLAYRAGQRRTYLATLEQDSTTRRRETQQFDSLSVSPPIAVSTPYHQGGGSYVARLNAGGSQPQPLGPLTQLGVQKGDTVTVSAYGYYAQARQHGFWFSLGSFLASLVSQQPSAPVGGDPSHGRKNLPLLQIGVATGLPALSQSIVGVPLGYLRLLVFDKDSVLVSAQTRQVQLTAAAHGGYEPLQAQVVLAQDGYVTAYVGNESDVDVLFDDVRVEHWPGMQVQEVQYDPAGLELAGLAPPSPGIRGLNNYRFNGKEFQGDLSLAWNHQDWRFFDPQLLRWHSVDPKVENGQENESPYVSYYNNSIRYADPEGLQGGPVPGYAGDNPMFYLEQGLSQMVQAGGRLIDKVGTYINGVFSLPGKDETYEVGLERVRVTSSTEYKAEVKVATNLEAYTTPNNSGHPNTKPYVASAKFTVSSVHKAEVSVTARGVNVRASMGVKVDMKSGERTNTSEVSVGKEAGRARVSVGVVTATNEQGKTEVKVGPKVEVPAVQGSRLSIGFGLYTTGK